VVVLGVDVLVHAIAGQIQGWELAASG
jgi:hypothetical protein